MMSCRLAMIAETAKRHSKRIRQIDHDAGNHQHQRQRAALEQFLAHLRADKFDALELDPVGAIATGGPWCRNRARAPHTALNRFSLICALVMPCTSGRRTSTSCGVPKFCTTASPVFSPFDRGARLRHVRRFGVTQLGNGAAGEIDTVVQAFW